ncbi:protein ImuB [Aliidongia dinghuensis]|uniref:DNA-directed DNA polymerase n=1 Tax=Aliidongia dinghuensis TaxID=1867774 RepID=A0A8J3E2Z0_9PROT|nr:protein ImuB [Aliidongia dinghuensis]
MLSLWLSNWATDRVHRRRRFERSGASVEASPADRLPLVTVADLAGRRVLAAVDPAAALAGLTPGMSLADARARVPDLSLVDADPEGDALALARFADWCGRYSPWTAVDGADGVWIDVTGSVPLFESEAALARDLVARAARLGFAARAAVADTPGAAWAVARYGALAEGVRILMPGEARPGEARGVLADLPVAGLRLAGEIVADLKRLGLKRIGDLYGMARAPLAPRFGEAVARRLDQALGLVEEPISPRQPTQPRLVRRVLAEPISTAEAIEHGLTQLMALLCRRLETEGLGARRIELACYRVDAQVERITIGTSEPSHAPAHLARLLAEKIGTIAPGFGIELMQLEAHAVEAMAPRQQGLDARADQGAVAPLVDRLANRLGARNVLGLVPVDSHLPERAARLVSLLDGRSRQPGGKQPDWTSRQPRPIRLLAHPDPIEVMAPVPDDPPLMFRWRRVPHRVRRAEGPERIALEWWHEPPIGAEGAGTDGIRDYYRVEDEAGRRFWLYRRGLYRPEVPPAWFLHGFFP